MEDTSTFVPSIWPSASSDTSLTTNACESLHSEFNLNFYHHRPNIFKIIELVIMFQTNTYIKIRTPDIDRSQQKMKKNKTISITEYQIIT